MRTLFLWIGGVAACANPQVENAAARCILPVHGGCLYYEAQGSGPPVVFVNGGAMDLRQWDAQARALAPEFQVIRYDARGWGRSTSPTKPYSQAEDLRALLDHVEVDRAHVIGLSHGGSTALDFALVHAERVRSLVLVGPLLEGFKWSEDFREREHWIAEGDEETRIEHLLGDLYFIPGARRDAKLGARARELLQSNSRVFSVDFSLARPLEPPAIERLEELSAPTLVIVGERDHPDVLAIAEALEARVPSCELYVLPGAGHMAHLEFPEDFNSSLRGFLRTVERERRL